jgi:hypothetical protein
MYMRFYKSTVCIELLVTDFDSNGTKVTFSLYPDLRVSIPRESLATATLHGVSFSTLNVDLMWAIKQTLHNTLGRIVTYKGDVRRTDLAQFQKLVDRKKAKYLLSRSSIAYKRFSCRIPTVFM